MKNISFALVMFSCFLGYSQVDLVKWNGTTDLEPTIQNNYIIADNFTGQGLSSGPTASYDGIIGTGWPNANAIDTSKYFQITVGQLLTGQFTLNNINMGYKGNCKTYEVRYSKSADFSNPITIIKNTEANFYNSDIENHITGLNIVVNGGEKLYIRFYAYNGHNGGGNWKIRNFITLKGTINSAPTPLQGNYVIGSQPGSAFQTITSAVSALNLVGVSGATTFLLDNEVYNRTTHELFPIRITPYPGNTLYPVTFKPNANKNVTIEATNFPVQTNTPTVFKFEGVDNVTIDGSNNNSTSKNLVIFNNNPLNQEKTVVWIASENSSNGANNITIKNTTLKQATRDEEVSFGVFSAGNGSGTTLGKGNSADAANSNTVIKNNTFTKVGQAIYINGNSGNPSAGIKIDNNTIGSTTDADKPFLGIYLNNTTTYEISNNTISGILKNTTSYQPLHSGIIVNGNSSGSIFNNIIRDVYNPTNNDFCAGIYLNSSNNTLYNNMISNVRGNNGDDGNYNLFLKGHGVYIKSGSNNKLYYNTIYMSGTGNDNKRSACLYVESGTAIELKNNILYNEQNQGTHYAVYLNVSNSQLVSDYNDLVAQNIGYSSEGNRQSLADWRTNTGKDAHSINIVPAFISATNLHLDNANQSNLNSLNGRGVAIANYTSDIDGDVRHATMPDMGADEFSQAITTWNGTGWSNGAPVDSVDAIIDGTYETIINSPFSVKNLTITTTGSITVKTGTNLIVTGELKNEGAPSAFVVESGANLIQRGATNLNSGSIQIKRTAAMRRLDYVYWSAPVVGQNLKAFSPETVSPPVGASRFYDLNETTNQFYTLDPLTTNFVPAKGFMIRAPNNFPANGAWTIFNGIFNGTPNSGDYSINMTKAGLGYNLLGNPYASTIDADEFLRQNQTVTTLYFWTHGVPGDTSNSANYATHNFTGGTAASVSMPGNTPNGTIQVGQGFLASTTVPAVAKFTNSMRVGNLANQFYRGANTMEKNRYWLNLSTEAGALNQVLVGYITDATNGVDDRFDAKLMETSGSKLYNIIDGAEYVIQGKALPFSQEDVVALGFKTVVAGNFTIKFDHADGLFLENQAIFLKDNLTGITHDIKESAYTFSSEAGTFNGRFEVVYQSTLGVKNPIIDANSIIAYKDNTNLVINSGKEIMKSVTVFDIRGRVISETKNINSGNASVSLATANQVLIVKVTLDNNSTITKKVIY